MNLLGPDPVFEAKKKKSCSNTKLLIICSRTRGVVSFLISVTLLKGSMYF